MWRLLESFFGGGGEGNSGGQRSGCTPLLLLQVTQHCEERGRLMADVWIGYSAMLDRWASKRASVCVQRGNLGGLHAKSKDPAETPAGPPALPDSPHAPDAPRMPAAC